jgi:ribosomal-protein-alanine acetyltransferase
MTVVLETVRDAAGVTERDAAALLALEAATQDRPLALATLLRESAPEGIVLIARAASRSDARAGAGALVGFASARLLVDEVHVFRLAVDPALRRRGTGRTLLDAIVGWARESGAAGVVLEVRADNVAAQQLYASAGFIQDGRRPRYYPDDEDALLLRHPIVTRTGASGSVPTGGM